MGESGRIEPFSPVRGGNPGQRGGKTAEEERRGSVMSLLSSRQRPFLLWRNAVPLAKMHDERQG